MKALAKKSNSKSNKRSPFINGIGNTGFFKIQAKLNVGKPNDKYEVEADKVADTVMRKNSNENSTFFAPSPNNIQRQPGTQIQEKPLAEFITPLIQRKEENNIQRQEEEEEMVQAKTERIQKQEEEEENGSV